APRDRDRHAESDHALNGRRAAGLVKRDGATLAALLGLALAVRVWGIHYGLPWLFYFHDEPQIVLRALRFGTGDLNPHFFLWPATPLLYLAFVSYAGWFVIGRVAGAFTGASDFAAAYFRDPSGFYLIVRTHSVAFGVWGVWLAQRLGRAAYGDAVGWAAAVGLALNAWHAHYSHFAHPVTAMSAFTLLGLWAAVRIADGGGRRDLVIAAVALGAGTACQYHAGLLAVPIAVAVLLRAARAPGEAGRWLMSGAAVALGGVALFLALSPFVVLDSAAFRADLAWIAAKTEGSLSGQARSPIIGLLEFVRTCVIPSLGMPLAIAAAVGTLWALVRRTSSDLVLLAFAAGYLALASRAATLNDRYAIPLVVPAVTFAARAISEMLSRAWPARAGGRIRMRWAPTLAIGILGLPVTLELIETDFSMTRDDTRIEALRWFEREVPADARVVADMLKFWNTATAPIAENPARIRERLAEIDRGMSGAGHGAAYREYFQYRLTHPHRPGYWVASTDMGFSARSLADYRADGFQWAMVSGEVVDAMRARAAPADSSGPAFYRALAREATPIASFEPQRWQRRGPRIVVYRLSPR
ncbi:MAG: hypothetical protein HOP12_06400, partial [Candidatus Eisenbacteria bacterium]|nr:hypothetical protein [Candidatus Eisenbacteria bacterium]